MNNGLLGFPYASLATAPQLANDRGRLLRITSFTNSGVWRKSGDVGSIVVMLLGGGGGGGGAQGRGSSASFGGSGGGGGGCLKKIEASALLTVEAITIGGGGSGGLNSPTDGSSGGTTSFGTHCSALGGRGGSYHGTVYASSSGTGANGGVGVGGDVNFRGSSGVPAGYMSGHVAFAFPGGNGALPIGGGGASGIQSAVVDFQAAGVSADPNSGGGGSGGAAKYNDSASKMSGGDGGSGLCVIYEYA